MSHSRKDSSSTCRQGRFTLIELLVVVSIISILASLLLPALSRAKHSAHKVVCASNLKQASIGLLYYADDYHDWLPMAITPGAPWDPVYTRWSQTLYNEEIIEEDELFKCPRTAFNPSLSRVTPSYGLNIRMGSNNTQLTDPWWWQASLSENGSKHYRISRTKKPSSMYLVGDATGAADDSTYTYFLQATVAGWGLVRHQNSVNMVFHDLHVESLTDQSLDLNWSTPHVWKNE